MLKSKIFLAVTLLVLFATITLAQNMGCSSDRDCLSNYKCTSISKPNNEKYNACLPNSDERTTIVNSMESKARRISSATNSLNGIVLAEEEEVALSAKSDITTSTATTTTAPTTSSITLVDKNGAVTGDVGAGSANTENDEEENTEEEEENDEEENEEEEEEEEEDEEEDDEDEDEDEEDDEDDEDE